MKKCKQSDLLLESRDCPLLPTAEQQCPFAEKGKMCDVERNHSAFRGVFKVVFRGITGHQAAVQKVYERLKEINPELKELPLASQAINDKVVTMVWRNNERENVFGDDEVNMALKISAVDTTGKIFPRYIHHCVIGKSVSAQVKQDYVRIHNMLQGRVSKQTYLSYMGMIQKQFFGSGSGSSSTLNIMYQEFGGQGFETEFQKAMKTNDLQSNTLSFSAIVSGLKKFYEAYLEVLGKNQIAHMDIHTGNVVAQVSRTDNGIITGFDLRLIDFGYSQRDVCEFVKHGYQIRSQDPIEYLMLKIALYAINLTTETESTHLVRVKNKSTSNWDEKPVSEVKATDVWISVMHYQQLIRNYEYLFRQAYVMHVYEYVYQCLTESLKYLFYRLENRKVKILLDAEIVRIFQWKVYGSSITDMDRNRDELHYGDTEMHNAKKMFDTFAILKICIEATEKMKKHIESIKVDNQTEQTKQTLFCYDLRVELSFYKDALIKRFGPFQKILETIQSRERELSFQEDFVEDMEDEGDYFMHFLAASSDETVMLYTLTSVWGGQVSILNFVNRKKENIFTCLIWHDVTAARFEPGTYEIMLWTKDSGMLVMHVGDKRYRKYTGSEVNSPTTTLSTPLSFMNEEMFIILKENILILLEDKQ